MAGNNATKAVPQNMEDTLKFYGKKLFGSGKAAEAAGTLQKTPARREADAEGSASSTEDSGRSKMVDPKTGIRFAKGGLVRRGYGKARGA